MAVRNITPPAQEPISLADAKTHLRVDITDDDDLITTLIIAAREFCEDYCHRAFVTQTWQLVLDHFPGASEHSQGYTDVGVLGDAALGLGTPPVGYTYRYQSEIYFRAGAIIVPRPRLISVDFIQYLDLVGNMCTLDPSQQYVVDNVSEPARIVPAPNLNWPLTEISTRAPIVNAVVVQFQDGYGPDPSDVPSSIVAAMKLLIGHWYEHRTEVITGLRAAAVEIPTAAEALLWRNKIVTFP